MKTNSEGMTEDKALNGVVELSEKIKMARAMIDHLLMGGRAMGYLEAKEQDREEIKKKDEELKYLKKDTPFHTETLKHSRRMDVLAIESGEVITKLQEAIKVLREGLAKHKRHFLKSHEPKCALCKAEKEADEILGRET